MLIRYSRWDGTQSIFDLDADQLMEALSDDLISDGDLWNALRRMLRWGDEGRLDHNIAGLQELIERLRERRQRELERWKLDSVMDDIAKKLDEIIETERQGIQRRLDAQSDRRQGQDAAPDAQTDEGDDAEANDVGEQDARSNRPRGDRQSSQTGDRSKTGQRSQMSSQQTGGQQGRQSGGQQGQQPDGQQGQQPDGQQGQQPDGQQGTPGDLDDSFRKMLEQIAQRKQQFLDNLPRDPGGRIQKLSDYEFMDESAREQFQELLKMLQQQVMQQYFQGLQQSIQNMTPEDLSAIREMVKDLNRMLEERAAGGQPDFQQFKEKHGRFFPPDINSLDELIEHLQQQMAQMQGLLNSMSPEQRSQLQSMLDNLFRDDRLKWDLAQLAANLQRLSRQPGPRTQFPFRGDDSLTMEQALRVMEQLQGMDQLEAQLRRAQDGPNIDQVDSELVRKLLGEESRQDLEQLKHLTKVLEEAGYVQRVGDRLELTPRGMRKIGQKALEDIFAHLKRDRFGKHAIDDRGAGGERIDDTKRYEFGDPFLLDLERTLMNSVHREGIGTPVRLRAEDFEVFRTEQLTQTSTVLMLDMSRSMILRGCFFAAKKVALALNSLIRGEYPRDNLYILGFSYYANRIKPEQLPQLNWDAYEYGTNMQHGFMLARQLLARHKGGNRQIIMITDGEPTAHIEPGTTRPVFNYPPTPRTFQETLREVVRCTREGITINTFMLERGHYLTSFVNQMTKINKGRAFFTTPDRLGEYILVDYVANKRKTID